MALEPFEDKWRSFGWKVKRVDGHDHAALVEAMEFDDKNDRPVVLICDRIRGCIRRVSTDVTTNRLRPAFFWGHLGDCNF